MPAPSTRILGYRPNEETKPAPVSTRETKEFWEGCAKGELLGQKCGSCGHYQLPPRLHCENCLAEENLAWVKASGKGKVASFSVVHRAPSPAFAKEVPYILAMITLDEGPHLLSNIVGCPPNQVRIGMPVEVVFEKRSDQVSVPNFRKMQK
jgi:uncharacterized protein